jgi:hypothetical protein
LQRHQANNDTPESPRQANAEGVDVPSQPSDGFTWKSRAEREAERAAEHEAKRAELAATIAKPGAVDAETAIDAAQVFVSGNAARDASKESRPLAQQLAAYRRPGELETRELRAAKRAQHAKPPPHIVVNQRRECEAEKAGRRSAAKVGRRDVDAVWFPWWVRDLARRVIESKGRALNELGCVHSRPVIDSILSEAAPYGGAESVAGRSVIALALVAWWLGQRLNGRISGLPREAWTSLTVGTRAQHYSGSSVWHPVHDAEGDLLPPEFHGQKGGRIGAGRNRGFMVAVSLAGFMRLLVPNAAQVPAFMLAPSGWPYVQVLVYGVPPGDTS